MRKLISTTVSQLLVGDIVVTHGMRCRVDTTPKPTSHGAHWCKSTVLNRDDVSAADVPIAFTSEHDFIDGRWQRTRDDVWTLQGNELYHIVREPRS